jgi:penicillin-binding protein 1A
MKVALADKSAVPFRVPAGIKLVRVDPKTGMRTSGGGIYEAFKPGTAPPENYAATAGLMDPDGRPIAVSPEADRMIRSNTTGGLW